MNLAYVRVSTEEQNEDRQIEGLKCHNIDRWYIEKVSGKNLLTIVQDLNSRGIYLVSNKEGFDTSTATGELMLTMIAAINQFERRNMLERQAEGIVLAKKRNAYKNCGRKKKQVDDEMFRECFEKVLNKEMTKTEMAAALKISRPTLDKVIARRYAA